MSYKIPAETCVLFQQSSIAFTDFSVLDIRLGLEQIQDWPTYRAAAEARWAESDPSGIETGPDEALEAFCTVTPRHQSLTVIDVRKGLDAVVDTQLFKNSCLDRWHAWDISPWLRPGDPQVSLVDLGAMPHPGDLAA